MRKIFALSLVLLFVVMVTAAYSQGKESKKDEKFVQMAAISGMFEVEAGKLAAQKGQSDGVRQFGQRMVTDHTTLNTELLQTVQAKGLTAPKELDATHKKMLDRLSTAPDFDKVYIKEMVEAHKKDIKLFEAEANKGQDPDLKALAAKALPVLKEHLSMVQGLAGK